MEKKIICFRRIEKFIIRDKGTLIPNAPTDMFAGLGKNNQKLYVVPSQNLVVIRMGEVAFDTTFTLSSFDNDLWEKINDLMD